MNRSRQWRRHGGGGGAGRGGSSPPYDFQIFFFLFINLFFACQLIGPS